MKRGMRTFLLLLLYLSLKPLRPHQMDLEMHIELVIN